MYQHFCTVFVINILYVTTEVMVMRHGLCLKMTYILSWFLAGAALSSRMGKLKNVQNEEVERKKTGKKLKLPK